MSAPTHRLKPEIRAALKRMDPAELMVVLAIQGQGVDRRHGETYSDWLEREQRIVLAAGHKVRIAATMAFTRPEREESRRWLLDNGFRLARFDA